MPDAEYLIRIVREEGVPTIYVYADLVEDESGGWLGTPDVQRAVDGVSEALYPYEACVIAWDFIGNERVNSDRGVMRQ